MPITATFTNPTKIINGNVTPVTIRDWAQQTLSAEEFTNFTEAYTREIALWANAISANTVTITSNGSGIGRTVTFYGDVEHDTEYVAFQTRYMADTTLTWDPNYGNISV